MNVKELKAKLDDLMTKNAGSGDLEVFDENKIGLTDIIVDDHNGKAVIVLCH